MDLSIYLNMYAFNISKQIRTYLSIEYLHVLNLLSRQYMLCYLDGDIFFIKSSEKTSFHIRHPHFNANSY